MIPGANTLLLLQAPELLSSSYRRVRNRKSTPDELLPGRHSLARSEVSETMIEEHSMLNQSSLIPEQALIEPSLLPIWPPILLTVLRA